MSEIEFIIDFFKYLDYTFVEEYTNISGNNRIIYTDNHKTITVYFNYDTGKIRLVNIETPFDIETPFETGGWAGAFEAYIRENKIILRDYNLSLLLDR